MGIAGPTLAYWLLEHEFRPVLVERSPHLRTGGYVVDFWGLGFDVAEGMGLLPDLRRQGCDVEEVRFVDHRGRRAGGFGADVFRSLTNGRYLSLARSDLAKLIYRTIEGRCETIFGDSITALEQADKGVTATFERSSSRRFDIVVGADGLHSNVRSLEFGSQERFEKYLGYFVAAFETKGYRPRDGGAYVSYAVPGAQVARFPMHDDRTLFMFVFAAQQAGIDSQYQCTQRNPICAIWRHRLGMPANLGGVGDVRRIVFRQGRSDSNGLMVERSRGSYWRCRVLSIPLSRTGGGSRDGGSYVLAGELSVDAGDAPENAFQRYEQKLRPLIVRKQLAAEKFARSFVPMTRLGVFIRNQITRAFAIPSVAEVIVGRDLRDQMGLPRYEQV